MCNIACDAIKNCEPHWLHCASCEEKRVICILRIIFVICYTLCLWHKWNYKLYLYLTKFSWGVVPTIFFGHPKFFRSWTVFVLLRLLRRVHNYTWFIMGLFRLCNLALKYWIWNFGFDFKWQNYLSSCINMTTQNFPLLLFLVLTEFWIFW